jgi:hypothetical protein
VPDPLWVKLKDAWREAIAKALAEPLVPISQARGLFNDEVERHRSAFPDLAKVDEVWFVETVTASADGLTGYVDFKLYVNRQRVENIAFNNGKLFSRSKDGIPIAIS